MTEDEAWEAATARNLELGTAGAGGRYAVAVCNRAGEWFVEVTSDAPPRVRWKGLREWARSWRSLGEPLPSPRDPQSVDEALERLRARKGGDRAIAAQDLARLFPDEARTALRPLLADDDWRVRSVAVECVHRVCGRAAWLTYADLLRDPNVTVARSAWSVIRRVAGPGDVAEILEFSATAHPKVRSGMRAAAGRLANRRT